MSQATRKCPICFHPGCEEILSAHDSTIRIKCPNCGQFVIDEIEEGYFENDKQFHKLAPALALERKLAGNDGYVLGWNSENKSICIGAVPFLSNYPKTFPEKLDRALLNIARKVGYEPVKGMVIPRKGLMDVAVAASIDSILGSWNDFNEYTNLFFSDIGNDTAVIQTLNVLKDEGLLNISLSSREKTEFRLTLKGVNRALELQKSQNSQKAFLAMWFSETLNLYVKAATEAARQAGYILERVNAVHHNGQIIDKVLNMINDARFVISDLTCEPETKGDKDTVRGGVRGGVYFEAGYAKGQNKQVILTCKEDQEARERIHFDLKQVNTIFWQENGGEVSAEKQPLVDVLRERIIFTVGKGPLYDTDESQRTQLGPGK